MRLGPEYEIAAAELDEIIEALKKVGSVYLADENTSRCGCVEYYDVRGNSMFLNKFYMDQP